VINSINQPGKIIYGVNTGFGSLADRQISAAEARKLSRNLIVLCVCGVGKPLREDIVRGMMLIRANMLANVTLLGEAGAEAVTIPRNALIRGGSDDRVVLALGEGRFAPRRVVAGAESGERVAILEGLAAGEQVVVAGQFLLDSEANLRAGFGRLGEESVTP